MLLAAAILALGSIAAHAADTTKGKAPAPAPKTAPAPRPANPSELARLLGVTSLIDEALNELWTEALKDQPAPPGKSIEEFRGKIASHLEQFDREVVALYQFSEEDAAKLIEFFRSPLGQKLIRGRAEQEKLGQLAEKCLLKVTDDLTKYLERAAPPATQP